MGDLPDFPEGKGCIIPFIVLIICAGILIAGAIALSTALSHFPAFS